MKALFVRILRQLKNDPRTLALMLVAPFLIMSLIYLDGLRIMFQF